VFAQARDLFATAAEHEGVAALEANHLATGARGLDHPAIDLVLADAGRAAPLADEHPLGVTASAVEHSIGDQFVMKHDIGVLQHVQARSVSRSGSPARPTRNTVPTRSRRSRLPASMLQTARRAPSVRPALPRQCVPPPDRQKVAAKRLPATGADTGPSSQIH
jgi:hypothetical protein